MSQYTTGTVTVTNASATVTGSGTLWAANVTVGSLFTITGSSVPYIVGAVGSDTSLTLTGNYAGSTLGGQVYSITTSYTPVLGIPYMERADVDTQTIFKRAMLLIETLWQSFVTKDTVQTITGAKTMTGSNVITVTSLNGGQLAGMRNRIINGDFRINQRSYVSLASLNAGNYGHDRWKGGVTDGIYSFTQLENSTTITIAVGRTIIQVVENKNIEGGNYIVSWTGTARGRVGVNAITPAGNFAVSPITITSNGAGETCSVEFAGSLAINSVDLGASTGTLGNVQMEFGSVATPFEQRPIGMELALCQRYYYRNTPGVASTSFGSAYVDSATVARVQTPFPIPMRISPIALEQNGILTNYAVRAGGVTTVCSAVPTIVICSAVLGTSNFTVASGLTVGHAGECRTAAATTAGFLGWSAEL